MEMGSGSRIKASRVNKKNTSETRRLLLLVLCVSCLFLSGLFIGYTHFVNHPSKPHDKDSFSKLTSSEKVGTVEKASDDRKRSLEEAAVQVAHSAHEDSRALSESEIKSSQENAKAQAKMIQKMKNKMKGYKGGKVDSFHPKEVDNDHV